jgi:glycosyltransferase involved in cell wall biosynthesis
VTRVLHAIAGAARGGAEGFFERLVPALGRAGVEQRVAIRRDPRRAKLLKEAGIEPLQLEFGGWFDFATRPALKRAIAEFKPQIVFTWMSRASQFCPKPSAGAPFVQVGRLGGYYKLKYFKNCAHLIGNTPHIVDYIKSQEWPADRVHYLPNFVQAMRADPVPRAALDTPEDAPLLLGLGRLHRNKGFDVLLRAAKEIPGAYLWLAGAGEEEAALKRLAESIGVAPRVRFLGWRDDVAALLAAADVFACSSRHEPLGNVVIEAWSAGRPVVAARATGPAGLIREGETGLLVPVDDVVALSVALKRLLADAALRARLAEAGRRAYEAAFTEPKVVAQYLAFFERVAAEAWA